MAIPIITQTLSEDEITLVRKRFLKLIPQEHLWERLLQHYSKSQRAYHNLSHIYSMLRKMDDLEDIANKEALELAIFYHDIIYNAKKKDNEEASAEYFKEDTREILGEKIIELVYDIIISTKKHLPIREVSIQDTMLDLDLYILASSRDLYQEYSKAIRIEYNWVPSILYKRGRKKVLQNFLERDRIYFSDYFYTHYEEKARDNLTWELTRL